MDRSIFHGGSNSLSHSQVRQCQSAFCKYQQFLTWWTGDNHMQVFVLKCRDTLETTWSWAKFCFIRNTNWMAFSFSGRLILFFLDIMDISILNIRPSFHHPKKRFRPNLLANGLEPCYHSSHHGSVENGCISNMSFLAFREKNPLNHDHGRKGRQRQKSGPRSSGTAGTSWALWLVCRTRRKSRRLWMTGWRLSWPMMVCVVIFLHL